MDNKDRVFISGSIGNHQYGFAKSYTVEEIKANPKLIREITRSYELVVMKDLELQGISFETNFDDVGNFHQRFDLDNVTHHGAGPRETSKELMDFRIKFMYEELQEFEEGYAEGDEAKMADALIDLAYVVFGTAHLKGYPWQALWEDVQSANMRKVRAANDGSDSKRGSSFDVVKPEGWVGPDTQGILEKNGFSE